MPEGKQKQPEEQSMPEVPAAGDTGQGQVGEQPPPVLPVLPLGNVVLFPGMVVPLIVNTPRSIRLVDEVVAGHRYLLAVLQRDPQMPDDQVKPEDLYGYGCLARLVKMLKFPDETTRILIHGVSRCKITHYVSREPGAALMARYGILKEEREHSIELEALARNAAQRFQEVVSLSPSLPDELKIAVMNIDDAGRLADLIAVHLTMTPEERQQLLEDYRPRSIGPTVERVWAVPVRSERAMRLEETVARIRAAGFEVEQAGALPMALKEARAWAADAAGGVCVSGSLYLVGECLEMLGIATCG